MIHEYINDFLYCVVKTSETRGPGTLVYCSGVNVTRFTPLTAGKHRLGQNPAVKGLQSSNNNVRTFILDKGAAPVSVRGDDCLGISPLKDDVWNSEMLLIENAPASLPLELIEFSLLNLLKLVLPACVPDVILPEKLPAPQELQAFLESLHRS